MQFMGEDVYDFAELKAYMSCGEDKIRAMVKAGKLPSPVRAGRKLVWFKSTIDVAVAAMRKAATDNIKKRAFQ